MNGHWAPCFERRIRGSVKQRKILLHNWKNKYDLEPLNFKNGFMLMYNFNFQLADADVAASIRAIVYRMCVCVLCVLELKQLFNH